MDPLSITSAAVSIATAALQSVQTLATTIDNIKDAPDTVKSISADLEAVRIVLQTLYQEIQSSSSQLILSSPITHAIKNCERACVAFQSQIEHWTRHSTEEKTFWIDRWNIGLFGQERIKTFKAQLNDCKGTLNVALSTATTITMFRQGTFMEGMKDVMLQQHESHVLERIVQAGNEAAEIGTSLQQLAAHGSSELSHGLEQSRQELLEELKNQQAANATLKEMCEEALSKTESERTGQNIKGVKVTNNSLALTGFINTSGEELMMKQKIRDVTADSRSVSVTGVAKGVDFSSLRPGGPGGPGGVGCDEVTGSRKS